MQEFVAVVEVREVEAFDVRGVGSDADAFGRRAFWSVVASRGEEPEDVKVVGVFDADEFDAMEGSQPENW